MTKKCTKMTKKCTFSALFGQKKCLRRMPRTKCAHRSPAPQAPPTIPKKENIKMTKNDTFVSFFWSNFRQKLATFVANFCARRRLKGQFSPALRMKKVHFFSTQRWNCTPVWGREYTCQFGLAVLKMLQFSTVSKIFLAVTCTVLVHKA